MSSSRESFKRPISDTDHKLSMSSSQSLEESWISVGDRSSMRGSSSTSSFKVVEFDQEFLPFSADNLVFPPNYDDDEDYLNEIESNKDMFADLDLDTSLSTLITSGKGRRRAVSSIDSDDDSTEIDFQFTRREPQMRMSTVRIISNDEMEKHKSASANKQQSLSSTSTSLSTEGVPDGRPKTRKKPRHVKKQSSNQPPFMDPTTVSYIAGISLVAGISFGAGYALGKRSGVLRVAG